MFAHPIRGRGVHRLHAHGSVWPEATRASTRAGAGGRLCRGLTQPIAGPRSQTAAHSGRRSLSRPPYQTEAFLLCGRDATETHSWTRTHPLGRAYISSFPAFSYRARGSLTRSPAPAKRPALKATGPWAHATQLDGGVTCWGRPACQTPGRSKSRLLRLPRLGLAFGPDSELGRRTPAFVLPDGGEEHSGFGLTHPFLGGARGHTTQPGARDLLRDHRTRRKPVSHVRPRCDRNAQWGGADPAWNGGGSTPSAPRRFECGRDATETHSSR